MEGESLETFVADIEDAVASVLAEQVVPGSGRARRGIDHSTDSDPLSDFASGEGLPPGNTLGTHGSWQSYFDGDYVWRGIKTRDFGFFSLAGWDVVAKLQFEYRMSLNGRQVRFWQKITVPQIWGEFKLGYNDSRCRIDRFGPDRDCDNHPNPSNGLGEWTRSLRQPEGGYDYVYDSSYARKFFEFEHYIKFRLGGSGSDETRWRFALNGQGPRFTCRADSVPSCSFV